uniref:hypothetical protein n=1 Tax=Azospirillum argentinense TaxID=2970906 RepID=UPI0010BFAF55|nr:hypothetical protein [Azospirillum argentinense]
MSEEEDKTCLCLADRVDGVIKFLIKPLVDPFVSHDGQGAVEEFLNNNAAGHRTQYSLQKCVPERGSVETTQNFLLSSYFQSLSSAFWFDAV